MWDKLAKQIDVERQQLASLIDLHRPLLNKCNQSTPSLIECSALAAMLHSFYTGIENIFKRIVVHIDEKTPSGPSWHVDLLEAVARATSVRAAVVSRGLCERLREYLEFRHFFRQAYTFQLQWEKMSHLVRNCEAIWENLDREIGEFLRRSSDANDTR